MRLARAEAAYGRRAENPKGKKPAPATRSRERYDTDVSIGHVEETRLPATNASTSPILLVNVAEAAEGCTGAFS
ncbi:hypothetical protein QFZ76_009385 [Streptomyces sp. V4I2]|nr:hypothetical protein [Streptomyces sp. V4I2]